MPKSRHGSLTGEAETRSAGVTLLNLCDSDIVARLTAGWPEGMSPKLRQRNGVVLYGARDELK